MALIGAEPGLTQPNWLPPADAWPELAECRAEHERLLGIVASEQSAVSALERRFADEDKNHSASLRDAFLGGDEPAQKATSPEDRAAQLAGARARATAATDALVASLENTLAEIAEKAPEWYDLLVSRRADADAKREQARRLVAEADAVAAEIGRMRFWLDRESGRSVLGHFPYAEMALPPAETAVTPDVVGVS